MTLVKPPGVTSPSSHPALTQNQNTLDSGAHTPSSPLPGLPEDSLNSDDWEDVNDEDEKAVTSTKAGSKGKGPKPTDKATNAPKPGRSWLQTMAVVLLACFALMISYNIGMEDGKREVEAECESSRPREYDHNLRCSACFDDLKSTEQLFKQCMDNTDKLCWYRKMKVVD